VTAPYARSEAVEEEEGIEEPYLPLTHYLWILRRHIWPILAFIVASVAATAVVTSRLTPIYESTAKVDIDRRTPNSIVGQESQQTPSNDADEFIATQVQLIESDSVLRPVFEEFKLTDAELETPRNNLPGDVADSPIVLKNLKVTRPPNTYILLITYRSADKRLAADIANAITNSYIEHTFDIRLRYSAKLASFMEKQLEEQKAKMERSSTALAQFEKELNVIDPEEKTSILSSRLLQLNTEYTNAQTDRVKKEASANAVKGGAIEAVQVSGQGEELKKLAERLSEAQVKMDQVQAQYGKRHPDYDKAAAELTAVRTQFEGASRNVARRVDVEYQEAISREAMLNKALADTKAEFDRLNVRSFEYQAVKREAEADRKLYEELTSKIKEAGINAGFQNSAIRLADPARPGLKPVFPRRLLNLALAFLLSTALSIGAALLRDAMDSTIRDPEQVRQTLSTELVGSLPLVKSWRDKPALALNALDAQAEDNALLAAGPGRVQRHIDSFEEAVRGLRNSILLGDFDRQLKSIVVTSAFPGEGKTTTAVNAAIAFAQRGERVLLVDADLRRGSLDRIFNLDDRSFGLSTVLAQPAAPKSLATPLPELPLLAVLPTGPRPPNPAEMLSSNRMEEQLRQWALEFDRVVIDTAPVLAVSDTQAMAALADTVILVARAGMTRKRALVRARDLLWRINAPIAGVVVNDVDMRLENFYTYRYGMYGYNYGQGYRNPRSGSDIAYGHEDEEKGE